MAEVSLRAANVQDITVIVALPHEGTLETRSRRSMSWGKAAVGVLVLGISAAIGAAAVYPLYYASDGAPRIVAPSAGFARPSVKGAIDGGRGA